MERITVYLSAEEKRKVEARARSERITLSALLRRALGLAGDEK